MRAASCTGKQAECQVSGYKNSNMSPFDPKERRRKDDE